MSRKNSLRLIAIVLLFNLLMLTGCLPEDSAEWSDDGSVGVAKKGNTVVLIDGDTLDRTPIAEGEIGYWPYISHDGKWIVYADIQEYDDLNEVLSLLPDNQVKLIAYHADLLMQEIVKQNVKNEHDDNQTEISLPDIQPNPLAPKGKPRNCIIRYLCDKADTELTEVLGAQELENLKKKKIQISHIHLVSIENKQIVSSRRITSNLSGIWCPKISPDGRWIAYAIQPTSENNNDLTWDLFVTDINGQTPALQVDSAIAYGYDWRPDSRALAYQAMDNPSDDMDDICLGTLKEAVIIDNQQRLKSKPLESLQGSFASHQISDDISLCAGLLFHPFSKVAYAGLDRIVFSTCALTLPSPMNLDPQWSVFCYDQNTKTVADVLPSITSGQLNDSAGLFSLSPDKTAILLPTQKHRFLIYTFGQSSPLNPISETDAFGDENKWILTPAWKGNDRITCLVSSQSHFFEPKEPDKKSHKLILMNHSGEMEKVLVENWADTQTGESTNNKK